MPQRGEDDAKPRGWETITSVFDTCNFGLHLLGGCGEAEDDVERDGTGTDESNVLIP